MSVDFLSRVPDAMAPTLFSISAFLLTAMICPCICREPGTKVLLISFDGFRWDYYHKFHTPYLDYIARTGVHAPLGIHATFTTKTFPSHYSIVTGLYQESHGIVDNGMYDPVFNETFNMRKTHPKWWDGGEPIWITARRQGVRNGVYFWPGSDVELKNLRPNFYFRYNTKVPFKQRIDTAVNWLAKEDVDLALVYFNQPDNEGHKTGAGGEGVRKKVEELDELLGYLLQKLMDTFLINRVNLIITSDHGMTNLTKMEDHLIALEKYVHLYNELRYVPLGGPVTGILPQEGKLEVVYNKLKNAHPNMTIYKKEEIPERYHYSNNRRIMPLIAVADEGYLIAKKHRGESVLGQHGYDNNLTSMRPIFFARGPDFKENYTTDIFEIVHIYPLLCYLIGVKSSPNNGSLQEIQHILRNSYSNPNCNYPYQTTQFGTTNHPVILLISSMLAFLIIFYYFKPV